MEIILDTADTAAIRKYNEIYNLTGVTTNPSILKKAGRPFWEVLKEIRSIIGDKQLHVQVTAKTCEEMVKEADKVVEVLGKDTYLKVPTNEEGIRTIKVLKAKGYKITATAIYTAQQAMLAATVGADYVAPYFNRMCNNNYDAPAAIEEMAWMFEHFGCSTKILAASFKNSGQIMQAINAGAHAVTASPELFTTMVESPLIDSAVEGFHKDWVALCGDKKIYELPE